jgi:hypothetical protein
MKEEKTARNITPPTLFDALIPILSLILLLGGAVYLYGSDATGGPIQVAPDPVYHDRRFGWPKKRS